MLGLLRKKVVDEGIGARVAPRYEAEIEGRLCLAGTDHGCVIRNVSVGGMTVVAPTASPCIGQQVIVDTERLGALYGIVRWHRDGSFGMQFQTPMALDLLNHARQEAPKAMRPGHGRARLSMAAVAHFNGMHRPVEVGNIAVGGLMMQTRLAMRPGQGVMIEFPNMRPIGGHVRWAEATRCGMMFTKLLPIAMAEEIAERARLGEPWLADVRAAHEQAAG